jgi:hypothetical protein
MQAQPGIRLPSKPAGTTNLKCGWPAPRTNSSPQGIHLQAAGQRQTVLATSSSSPGRWFPPTAAQRQAPAWRSRPRRGWLHQDRLSVHRALAPQPGSSRAIGKGQGRQIHKTRPSQLVRPARQAEHPANTMISADRTVIAFDRFGDGPPVLMVAGHVLDGEPASRRCSNGTSRSPGVDKSKPEAGSANPPVQIAERCGLAPQPVQRLPLRSPGPRHSSAITWACAVAVT